jgi:hypothetical protein
MERLFLGLPRKRVDRASIQEPEGEEMTDLLHEEERLGQLLLQLADVDADLVIQLDPEMGSETTEWPVNFTTLGNSVQCTATLYERFNGTVVLRIDADVQTVVDTAEVRRWVTSYTGWMPFVQARIDQVNRKKVKIIATHSFLANEVTRAQLEQTLGSLDYVAAKWGVALSELETARESEENDTAQEEHDEDPFAIDTSKIATETPVTAPSVAGLEEALKNIDDLVGLGPVKRLVHQFVAVQRAQLVRKGAGLKVLTPSPHLVFKGNPGTGKTTVARHVGRLYHELGLLSRGHLVEVDRSGLVGGYVGQTALKTKEVLDSAKGGVLFIDEAYALNRPHANDYGHEVMETVLTYMENNRGDLVVVVAGYPAEMDDFLKMNPGIASRFDYTLDFPDFSDDELVQIFVEMAAEHDYTLDELAIDALKVVLSSWGREEGFGNARDIRRLFHGVVAAHSEWVVESGLNSGAELSRIQSVHVPLGEALAALGEMEQNKNLGPGYL